MAIYYTKCNNFKVIKKNCKKPLGQIPQKKFKGCLSIKHWMHNLRRLKLKTCPAIENILFNHAEDAYTLSFSC